MLVLDIGYWRNVRERSRAKDAIIHLRAIQKSNHNIGIIEMRFTAGEDFEFARLGCSITKIAHD
jgi:hypothetical protein